MHTKGRQMLGLECKVMVQVDQAASMASDIEE